LDYTSRMGKHNIGPTPSSAKAQNTSFLLAHNNQMKRHEMHPGKYPGCLPFLECMKREIQILAKGRPSPLLATTSTTSAYSRRVLQGFEPKTAVTLSAGLTTQPPRLASACVMTRRSTSTSSVPTCLCEDTDGGGADIAPQWEQCLVFGWLCVCELVYCCAP